MFVVGVDAQGLLSVCQDSSFCARRQFQNAWCSKGILDLSTESRGFYQARLSEHRQVLGRYRLVDPRFSGQLTDTPRPDAEPFQQEDTYWVRQGLEHVCCQFAVHSLLFSHDHIVAMLGNLVKATLDNVEKLPKMET